MNKKIVILGGYGDGELIAWALRDIQYIEGYGWLNDQEKEGSQIASLPVLGKINRDKIANLLSDPTVLFMTALQRVKNARERLEKIKRLAIPPERYYSFIHPSAYVAPNVIIGYDTFIGFHVCIMPNTIIGNHCSFRSSAHVGHDWAIKDGCFVGPNSSLLGRGILEEGVHIGPNVSIENRVKIGEYAIVGMGSVVTKDVPGGMTVIGSPAREMSDQQRLFAHWAEVITQADHNKWAPK
jgi:sugar O-acyltransferase (sialic acid O-acetyltransferase NeuD family)